MLYIEQPYLLFIMLMPAEFAKYGIVLLPSFEDIGLYHQSNNIEIMFEKQLQE